MRALIIAAGICLLALPAASQSWIPQAAVQEIHNQCPSQCRQTNALTFCSQACACVAGEINRNWTADDFRARGGRLAARTDLEAVQAEISQLAQQCARGLQG